jgi:DNA-binding IclR family transcriptional regulator
MSRNTYNAPAARNAIRIVECLCESPSPIGVREICRQTGLNPNMVFRLLKTLHDEKWILSHDDGAKYAMSLRPFHFAGKVAANMSLSKAVKDPLQELWRKTGESCYLGIRDETRTLFLEHLDATGDIKIAAKPGGRFLMHCAAPGKVLLAYSTRDCVINVIKTEGLPAQTPATITSQAALFRQLNQIRMQGFAVDGEEYASGLICFAAPVFGYSNQIAGTIGLSVLTLNYSLTAMTKKLGPLVIQAANKASANMGSVKPSEGTKHQKEIRHD